MSTEAKIRLSYFSDVLCVWAYVSQVRLDELERHFADRIEVSYHFIPVFGTTARRIGDGWAQRGSYDGFCAHVLDICREFPHTTVHPDLWRTTRPRSSAMAHLVLKAVQTLESQGRLVDGDGARATETLAWAVRLAFFRDNRDVSSLPCLLDIVAQQNLPVARVRAAIEDGTAMAALCRDVELRDEHRVEGSPTYLLNDGRQKLYGNIGYRILEANVREVLERPSNRASWC
ncbi:MAG: DsbA family protein [Gammaproteobacteria bacterium]|nr:DsbA family protein [Gammaproteobacteria bacterium]